MGDNVNINKLPNPLKLNLGGREGLEGSGEESELNFRLKDYISVDIRPEKSQICADIRNLPFSDNSVDVIRASHCLEHIYPDEVVPALIGWFRIMKPGGELRIYVPSSRIVCQDIYEQIKKNVKVRDMSLKNTAGLLIGYGGYKYDYHYTAFDKEFLNHCVEAAGFTIVSNNPRPNVQDLGVQARK